MKNSLIPKSQNRTSRFEARGIEIIINDVGALKLIRVLEYYKNLSYGVYAGFFIKHTEKDKSHIHIGIHLRDRPTKLYYKNLTEHFKFEEYKTMVKKLTNPAKQWCKKLQTYYNYCIDEEKHEGQIISEPLLYRWKPLTKLQQKTDTITNCRDYIYKEIAQGMTEDKLEQLTNSTTPPKLFQYLLRNHEELIKAIKIYKNINLKKKNREISRFHEWFKNNTYKTLMSAETL